MTVEPLDAKEAVVEPIIWSALGRVPQGRRVPDVDMAHAILCGLRRLRQFVLTEEGYAAAGEIDDTVRDALISRAVINTVSAPAGDGRVALPSPPRSLAALRTAAIVEDAAMSCVAVGATTPDGDVLDRLVVATTQVLVDGLIDRLSGVPHLADTLAAIRLNENAEDALMAAGDDPWPAVH